MIQVEGAEMMREIKNELIWGQYEKIQRFFCIREALDRTNDGLEYRARLLLFA